MVTFNLLPWRYDKQQYQIVTYKKMAVLLLIITCLTIILLDGVLRNKQKSILAQVADLQARLLRYTEFEPNPVAPNATLQTISVLQQYQHITHQLFNQFTELIVHRVCFTKIKRDNNKFIFNGEAPSILSIANLVSVWDKSLLDSDIKIDDISHEKNKIQFKLSIFVKDSK